jgi:fatty-acyl-CoA synthase
MQGYGMTENSPQICFFALKSTLADRSEEEIYSLRQTQGLPIPLLQIKVVSAETGEELPWDGVSIGDFHVRSPFTASEYYRDDRTKDSMIDGWLKTGDVGCIDPEGYVLLKDRSKDLIKSGGEWISTIDLENALMLHPKVAEATVVGIDDEKWLERPLACVVPTDPSLTEDELREHLLAEGFIKFWVPDTFLFVPEVPKTSVGKYDKKAIRGVVADSGLDNARQKLGASGA